MTRTVAADAPFRDRPYVLCSEEARWFAGHLFGRCEHARADAPEPPRDWRAAAPSPSGSA